MNKRIFLLVMFLVVAGAWLNLRSSIRERIDLPSSDELYCMHFDRNGLLWLGTSSGIKSYDGYQVRNEFAWETPSFPQLISDIRSITTDREGHLWAGSNSGLLRIDLATGYIRPYLFPRPSQQIIYRLFTSSKGTVYVGTDDGFSVYDSKTETFRHFNQDNTQAIYPNGKKGKYQGWGVKDFVETRDGDILIGTWSQGIWRYSPRNHLLRSYEKVNWMNSAYALCLDKLDRLWIGSQGYGVQRLERTDDYRAATLSMVASGGGDPKVVYDIAQLPDGKMFVCTGDTVCAQTGPDGALWLALREGGVVHIFGGQSFFSNHAFGSIRSIYTDNGRQFYLGYGMEGLAWYDCTHGAFLQNDRIPGFSAIPAEGLKTRIGAMVRRFNNELWMAAGDNGIFVSHADHTSETLYPHSSRLSYIKDNVTAFYEDSRTKTLWIGQRKGLSVLFADDTGKALDIKNDTIDLTGYFMVNHITADHDGNIWVASANKGIVCLSGNPRRVESMRVRRVAAPFSNITACFEDSRHRLWAICPGGLLMYDEGVRRFVVANQSFHLADRPVLAINEDNYGSIWLATDRALVRLAPDGGTISFTEQDGLGSTSFFANATYKYGDRLFFGTNKGFVDFKPVGSYDNYRNFKSTLLITDVLLDGASLLSLDSVERVGISRALPVTTREITVPASVRRFGLEFALLTYANQRETKYAFKLDGYDDDWQYVDGTVHRALYDHVPAGKYTFRLKAADSHGHWRDLPYTITVRVKAPWYASWWACGLYLLVVMMVVRMVWVYLRMQREISASRRFSSILQSAQLQGESTHQPVAEENVMEEGHPVAANAARQEDAQFIAKATQLVYDHLDDPDYNRDRLAQDFNMSVSTLYARLRDCTGLSIQVFIQTIRLNAASDILTQNPGIRISELAYRVGFNTPKYFSQCFKKKFGVLPGDYVK